MDDVKLSSKNQIVVPRSAREALRVKAGDRLLVVVRRDTVILLPKPKRFSEATARMVSALYPPDYLEKERKSWR